MATYSKRLFRHPIIPDRITRATSQLNVNFGGTVSIGAAYTEPAAGAGDSRNFIYDLSGVDSNGNTWPTSFASLFGANVKTRIQALPSEVISGADDAAKAVTLATLFNQEIRTLSAPVNGLTKYLHNEISARTTAPGSSPAPQTDPYIVRHGTMTTDLKRMCVRQVFRLPADLATKLTYPTANTHWLIVNDFKTGNYGGANGVGDYRYKLSVLEDGSGLYWHINGDNSANGFATIPSTDPDTTIYWEVDNYSVPVFLDEWLETYTFIKRPETKWVRTGAGGATDPYQRDTTSGRTVVVLHRLATNQWYLLCDKVGGIQMGVENCIWTRLFFITYCNASMPVSIDTLEIEFYDNLPFTLESKGLA